MSEEPREDIVRELEQGARTRGALVDATGWSENTISNHLRILVAEGRVVKIHERTGLYQLSNDD